jgi:hypothetical protein
VAGTREASAAAALTLSSAAGELVLLPVSGDKLAKIIDMAKQFG